jgi:hypothetical protein
MKIPSLKENDRIHSLAQKNLLLLKKKHQRGRKKKSMEYLDIIQPQSPDCRRQSIIGSIIRPNHHNVAPYTPFRVLPTAFLNT